MTIVCFVSGSGTNYQKIVEQDRRHDYVVFTNRADCEGVRKARANGHIVIELSHLPYLRDARRKYGEGRVPRNCVERMRYEQDLWCLIEERVGGRPELICLAGYDQWLTDWTVDRYYPGVLNIHPGDTTKGYSGLHWIPAARAILAGDRELRATVFIVDKGEDTGPVLAQSRPLDIMLTIEALEAEGSQGLTAEFGSIVSFARQHAVTCYETFEGLANAGQKAAMRRVCEGLQGKLKRAGDWEVYPFAVHGLVARGRVQVVDRIVYVDGRQMPDHGYRMDQESSG
jgi:folate-dependent phosphoribosylglycinamide formyltransferase PurN